MSQVSTLTRFNNTIDCLVDSLIERYSHHEYFNKELKLIQEKFSLLRKTNPAKLVEGCDPRTHPVLLHGRSGLVITDRSACETPDCVATEVCRCLPNGYPQQALKWVWIEPAPHTTTRSYRTVVAAQIGVQSKGSAESVDNAPGVGAQG